MLRQAAAVLALLPAAAHSTSLEQLLRLPFEHLLQLEITPARSPAAMAPGARLPATGASGSVRGA